MSESINPGSGGGIHPGAPVIWPTSKNTKVQQVQQAQQSGQATTVAAQAAKESSVAEQIAQQAQQAQQTAKPTVARSLSKADISQQLVEMGLPASKENVQIANKMLLHGLELSADNFNALFKLMKGSGANNVSQQAALIALSRGLHENQSAAKTIENFLLNNPQLAQQLQSLQAALAGFKAGIAGGKELMSPQLLSQLTQLLTAFDDKYQKVLKGEISESALREQMMKGNLLKDLAGMRSLLTGIARQLANTRNEALSESSRQLARQLINLAKNMGDILQNLTAQSIFSKSFARQDSAIPDKYLYWQIPNAFSENPSTVEILIKRDDNSKKARINPRKTRVILKVETEEMGEVTVMIDVEEKNVWYIFNNENDQVREFIMANSPMLRDRLDKLNWQVKGIQAIKRKVDLKKYLMPTINLDSLKRISTEA